VGLKVDERVRVREKEWMECKDESDSEREKE
jgi:hypothetical protein